MAIYIFTLSNQYLYTIVLVKNYKLIIFEFCIIFIKIK
jgi:hypothetical protein